MRWLTSRNCRNIQHSLPMWTRTCKRSNGRQRSDRWLVANDRPRNISSAPNPLRCRRCDASNFTDCQISSKETIMSEKEEFEMPPAGMPKWITDHVELYLSDPEKAHLWDSTIGGGPGLLPTLL